MRSLRPLRSATRLDLLAVPAAHLTAGVAADQHGDVVLLVELVEHFLAAALVVPALVQALVGAEGDRGAEGEGRVLAEIIVRGGVPHLDGAVRGGVERLQAGHDFAAGEHLDLELVVGGLGDLLGQHDRAAIERIERLRPAGRHAPLQVRASTARWPERQLRRWRPRRDRRPSRIRRRFIRYPPSVFVLVFTNGRGPSPADLHPRGDVAEIMTEPAP